MMRHPICWLAIVTILFAGPLAAEPIDYVGQVKPILQQHCFACHGPLKQEAELRLDAGRLLKAGGESGSVVVAGEPDQSLLLERILETDPDLRMPQEGTPLSADEIDVLSRWVAEGASFPKDDRPLPDPRNYWSFQRPLKVSLPRVSAKAWRTNPIDRFIAAGHKSARVKPVPAAAPEQLLRRLYLDLVGLPPSREELHQFLTDPSEAAYQQVVDRLLDDPRYGERWGRHWMDIWRYSDWYGRRQVDDVRNSFPHIWRWRDWIIESLNEDKGYDQMVQEMLAADELYPVDDGRIAATGFLARNWFSLNYDTWMRDLVEHTGKAFLGLRFNCALCHDHKYDPISQQDYFRFRAFFEPLELRNDRVPGGPRLDKYIRYMPGSGASLKPMPQALARVYDFTLDAKTYMYRSGDQRDRFTDRAPVEPGVPGFLGELPVAIEIIDLPAEAHYPGIKTFIQQAELQQRQQAVSEAAGKADEVEEKELAAVTEAQLRLQQAEGVLAKELARPPEESPQAMPFDALVRTAVAYWDFEPSQPDGNFLEDRNGAHHALSVSVDGSGSVSLLKDDQWPADSALHQLPGNRANRGAVIFRHGNGKALLRTEPAEEFGAEQFTATAIIQLERSEAGLLQVILGSAGRWGLAVEGVDQTYGQLRFLSWDQDGELIMESLAGEADFLRIDVGREYFVAIVARAGQFQLVARVLEVDQPLAARHGALPELLAIDAGKADLRIGDLDGSAWWHGVIDEVGFWNRPLEVEELAVLAGTEGVNQAVVLARSEIQRARVSLVAASRPITVANSHREAAVAELASIEARIKADNSRYRDGAKDPAVVDQLRQQAAHQERVAEAASLDAMVAAEELAIAGLQLQAKTDEEVNKQLQAANAKLVMTIKQRDQARQLVSQPTKDYSLLSPVYPTQSSGRRRALAGWISDKQNPLTARVAVNHIWMRHFGRPLVESVMDLGRSGKQPSHPELLDWLAVELMEQGWSMKHLHRLIVTSMTYRMQTSVDASSEPNRARDKDNRWWWRMEDRRMEAEMVRDSILAVSGQLDLAQGGPELDPASSETVMRRSLYFAVYPEGGGQIEMLGLFDPPDPCDCYRRSGSVVPQQSLALVNSRMVLDQGRLLARRLEKELSVEGEPLEAARFIRAAFEQVLSRGPRPSETAACLAFLEKQSVLFSQADLSTDVTPEGGVAPSKDPAARARESLVRTLFSHNDFITIH
jgi:mono/diheme cytochrome c family protein